MERTWSTLYRSCKKRWDSAGLSQHPDWAIFTKRLDQEFPRLAGLLWEIYGTKPDFAYQVEETVQAAFEAWTARPSHMRKLDEEHPVESGWFTANDMVGAVCYTDRFAGTFRGLLSRLGYLKKLGINYLHLMPFFLTPQPENDGGYAVSSYRQTDPSLGSMADLEQVSQSFAQEGISLVADFVFNHTSNEHE
jgi:amylosucrase